MSHDGDILDGSIRHQQSMFKIEISPIQRRALDCLLDEGHIFRMNPLKNEFHGGFRGGGVLEDSKGFLRPENLAAGGPPAETARLTEPLSLRQVRFPASQSGLSVFQLGVGSYKFTRSLHNTEFQIVACFLKQSLRTAA